jgi:hypothetical protein
VDRFDFAGAFCVAEYMCERGVGREHTIHAQAAGCLRIARVQATRPNGIMTT